MLIADLDLFATNINRIQISNSNMPKFPILKHFLSVGPAVYRSSLLYSHTVTGLIILLSNLARRLANRLARLFRSRLFRSPFVIRPIQFIDLDMPTKQRQGGFYAVRKGREVGVFKNWYVPAT